MKKFEIYLDGRIFFFINNITYKIKNKNDCYLLTNSIDFISIEYNNLIDAINELKQINKQSYNENKINYKKSESYKIRLLGIDEFIIVDNIEILKEEVNMLCKNGLNNSIEIKTKMKKTYKNRYFMIINNNKTRINNNTLK